MDSIQDCVDCGHAPEYHNSEGCLCFPCNCNQFRRYRKLKPSQLEILLHIQISGRWYKRKYVYNKSTEWAKIWKMAVNRAKKEFPHYLEIYLLNIFYG